MKLSVLLLLIFGFHQKVWVSFDLNFVQNHLDEHSEFRSTEHHNIDDNISYTHVHTHDDGDEEHHHHVSVPSIDVTVLQKIVALMFQESFTELVQCFFEKLLFPKDYNLEIFRPPIF